MRIFLAAGLLTIAACAGDELPACTPAPEPIVVAHGAVALDLISPTVCQQQLGKLRQCTIPPTDYASPPIDTAVPLRTTIQRQLSGNCSTPYGLSVAVEPDGAPPVTFPYLSQSQLVLRRAGGAPFAQLSIADNSPWTAIAVFNETCRVSLTVSTNEVDVDTVQQAEAILAAIDLELDRAVRDVRNYETLLALQAAYTFTQAVVASFHLELTSETMQQLRAAALAAAPAMEIATMGCGDVLSESQRDTLFQLYVSMVALGDPAAWQNSDGSTKTLAQFYGPGSAAVLARLEELASQANPDLETEFTEGLEEATAERIRLEQKRALAVQQLAPWLGGAP